MKHPVTGRLRDRAEKAGQDRDAAVARAAAASEREGCDVANAIGQAFHAAASPGVVLALIEVARAAQVASREARHMANVGLLGRIALAALDAALGSP